MHQPDPSVEDQVDAWHLPIWQLAACSLQLAGNVEHQTRSINNKVLLRGEGNFVSSVVLSLSNFRAVCLVVPTPEHAIRDPVFRVSIQSTIILQHHGQSDTADGNRPRRVAPRLQPSIPWSKPHDSCRKSRCVHGGREDGCFSPYGTRSNTDYGLLSVAQSAPNAGGCLS